MSENDTKTSAAIELELPNFYRQFDTVTIATEIDVYKNARDDFSYTPLLLVDWPRFRSTLDTLPIGMDTVMEVPIRIHFKDDILEKELLSQIRNSGVSVKSLTLLPHTFFKLQAKVNGAYQTLNPDDIPTSEDGISLTRKFNIVSPQEYRLRGKPSELEDFYKWRGTSDTIRGQLFSDGFAYTSDYVRALASFLSDSSVRKELVGDEQLDDSSKVTTSTSGAGLSLSFGSGSIGGGAGDTQTTTQRKRQRFLNRNYISDFVTRHKSKLSIEASASGAMVQYVLSSLVTRLFEAGSQVRAEFSALQNNEYQLVAAELGYARIGALKLSDAVKSAPKIEKIDDQTAKVKGPNGEDISVSKNNTFKTGDDIEWVFDGEAFIPTSVNLTLLSEYKLSSEFDFSSLIITKGGQRSTVTNFIYPALWLTEHASSYFNPTSTLQVPIGAILPFAGPKSLLPSGWELCDGKAMQIADYPELFAVLAYRWGRGATGTDFRIPNLQGLFLRGVCYTTENDPDASKRVNSAGEAGEVGSYQDDAIQNIVGTINGIKSNNAGYSATGAFRLGGYMGDGDGGEPRPCFNVTFDASQAVKTSSETRPRNVAVNYIIRAK